MFLAILAALVGSAIVAAADHAVPGLFGLEPIVFDLPLGTSAPALPPKSTFAQLVLLHLAIGAVGGAIAAVLSPVDNKLMSAAAVAFSASIVAALTGVFMPVGPDWYHALHFAASLIGPVLGARIVVRGRTEPVPGPVAGPPPILGSTGS